MKKAYLLIALFVFVSLACTVQLTATTPTEIPATAVVVMVDPTQTPVLVTDIPATTVPTQVPSATVLATSLPTLVPTQSPTVTQPPAWTGTAITYRPLSLVIPPDIATGASGLDIPRLDGNDAAWWQKTPGHLHVNLGDYYILQGKAIQPAINVYPASDYALMLPAAFESIHCLNNYLYAPNAVFALDQLPNVPYLNAKILFGSNIAQLSFQNGSGIRFLTEYGQYPASANNKELFYNFIGVTSDGESYIVATFPVTSPVLAETSDAGAPLPARGIPYPYMADPNANMDAYYQGITDLLNTQSPDGFSPRLGELDALIQSMSIER